MTAFPPEVAALLADGRVMPLGPGKPVESVRPQLAALTLSPACMAGLWLRFDFLDESHAISQDLQTPEGSYWHAIMHRREGDFSNAKYWFRQAGPHPVLDRLRLMAPQMGFMYTNPSEFVDLCEKAAGTGTPHEHELERVQMLEWQILFDHCLETRSG